MVASRAGRAQVVQRLLRAGASTTLRNADHAAAVDIAKARGLPDVTKLLAAE
jgi:ankyrin repeat protein